MAATMTIEGVRPKHSAWAHDSSYGQGAEPIVGQWEAFDQQPSQGATLNGWLPRRTHTPKRSSVILSKDWAELLGVSRSGRVYRLSKPELGRRLAGINLGFANQPVISMNEPRSNVPMDASSLEWTESDDRAVAELLNEAQRAEL